MTFKVEDFDRANPLWIKLVEHYKERLQQLREQNDAEKSPEQTAKIRGRIAECKYFLSLGNEAPIIKKEFAGMD